MCWLLSPLARRIGKAILRRCAAALVMSALAALPAAAAEFPLVAGQQALGDLGRHVVKEGEILPDIARQLDLGYTELAAANAGVDPWSPGAGRTLNAPRLYILPDAPHRGIVLNLGQYRLFYFPPDGSRVLTYPIGIGVIGWKTPFGTTRVVRKEANPVWYPPPSIRAQHAAEGDSLPTIVPAGPDNPLGAFALRLGWANYLIHGTNKPDGVGRNVSHGCIHLYPEDIAQLFSLVPVGTPVRVVDQPATAGWVGDNLYLEVYPSQAQTEEIDTEHRVSPDPATGVRDVVRAAAGQFADGVDWQAVNMAATERTGVPVLVATGAGGPEVSVNPGATNGQRGARDTDAGGSREVQEGHDRSARPSDDPEANYADDPDAPYDPNADRSGGPAAMVPDAPDADRSDRSDNEARFNRLLESLTKSERPGDRSRTQ
jgi:L,D-transpeptidase ErfK/SrfK